MGTGTTALHWAAYHENLPLVEKLLKAGADANAGARVAATPPLFLAATHGNAPIVKALLNAGANAKATSANGTTALMTAAASGSKETVDALLDAGADPNVRESVYGQTALMFAAAKNRARVIRVLINRGAEPNATSTVKELSSARFDDDGNPIPARPAANGAKTETADSGVPQLTGRYTAPTTAPPPKRTFGGNTALTLAAREGHMRAVQALTRRWSGHQRGERGR